MVQTVNERRKRRARVTAKGRSDKKALSLSSFVAFEIHGDQFVQDIHVVYLNKPWHTLFKKILSESGKLLDDNIETEK
jgi:hypothetical protein